MSAKSTRRDFLQYSLAATAAVAGATASVGAQAQGTAGDLLPRGKIKDMEVSRMILGGNLLTHFTHSRDLKYVYNLCEHYNTPDKIVETLAMAEKHGINTLNIHTVPWALDVLKRHRDQGGKIQWIICSTVQPTTLEMADYRKAVRELADNGTEGIYIWGVTSDKLVKEGKAEWLKKMVDAAKECGVPSGVGAHDLQVIKECEKLKVDPDFYIKTFHSHKYPTGPKPEEINGPHNEIPGYWCASPDETVKVMKDVEKPWIAFKIMAAGAIPPEEAFPYAFNSGADHILVGMFDWEIEGDVKLAKEVLPKIKRDRPWRS